MGSRAARNTFAALVALAVLAVPAAASAAPAEPQPARGRSAQAKQQKPSRKPAPAPTTSPQPKSNADMNKGGANNGGDCGAYCSTRDGSASQNGKGDGEAKGKPCAGCVGKADNKNPPGQQPNGSDHNAGYECDRNQGIGQSNPAHTGCTANTTPPPPLSVLPTETPCVPTDEVPCETPAPCVATDAVPCDTVTPTPSVLGVRSERPAEGVTPELAPSVLGVKYTRAGANPPAVVGGRLPSTGANVSVALLLLLGFGLVGGGVAVTCATPAKRH